MDAQHSDEPEVVWRSHPFRERRGAGLLVLGVLLILAAGLAITTASGFWGIFGFVVLFLSLEGFFLPTRYQLDGDGVKVARALGSRTTRPWSSFRRVEVDSRGMTLSPYRDRSWLEPYRAVRLLFDGGDRTAIIAKVRAALGVRAVWYEGRRA